MSFTRIISYSCEGTHEDLLECIDSRCTVFNYDVLAELTEDGIEVPRR